MAVRTCKGCGDPFSTKNSVKSYCDGCAANGVKFNCGKCGKEVTIKVASHRIYARDSGHVWICQTCAAGSDEAKAKRSEAVKQTWAGRPADHPAKVAVAARFDAARADPGVQAKWLAAVQSDEFREMKRRHAEAQFADPAQRERARQQALERWKDPEFRKRQSEANAERWAEGSPSRAKASESHKDLWEDPEYRMRMEAIIRDNMSSPETRAKLSEATRALMADPARREGISKALIRHHASAGLSDAARERTQAALDYYSTPYSFIGKLAKMGADDAVKYVHAVSRQRTTWDKLIRDITAVQGSCNRRDLAAVTGYSLFAIGDFCREMGLQGVSSNHRGLQNEVGRFIASIYSGNVEAEARPVFLRDGADRFCELDFYAPDIGVAVEVNGAYWHSEESGRDPRYHFNKSQKCREAGIRLIHVWEYEWENPRQRAVLESIIQSAFGVTERVFARKLRVEYRKSAEMREFFDTNNIQGFRGGEFAVCLVDPATSEIMMAYLVGKGSHMSRRYEYEIVRGASKLGVTVVGGGSKLLAALLRDKNISNMVYYVDYNYFDGNSLRRDPRWRLVSEQVGFKNYWRKTGEVRNREPGRHHEIKLKIASGDVLTLWNAGTATYALTKA